MPAVPFASHQQEPPSHHRLFCRFLYGRAELCDNFAEKEKLRPAPELLSRAWQVSQGRAACTRGFGQAEPGLKLGPC
jgi:hypothetical protein